MATAAGDTWGYLSSEESSFFELFWRNHYYSELPCINHAVLGLLSADQPRLLQRLIYAFAGLGDEQFTQVELHQWTISGEWLKPAEPIASCDHAFQIGVAGKTLVKAAPADLCLGWDDGVSEVVVFARSGDGTQVIGSFAEFLEQALEAAAELAREQDDILMRDEAVLALLLDVVPEEDPRLDGTTLKR